MASLKDIKTRIRSVQSTQQITKAMKMVASAKLRNAEANATRYRNFKSKIEHIALTIAKRTDPKEHFLLRKNDSETEGIFVVTSDRGLCGAFNSSLLKVAAARFNALKKENKDVKLWVIGRKGYSYFLKNDYEIANSFIGIYKELDVKIAEQISYEMIKNYKENKIGKITLIYNYFESMSSHPTVQSTILSISENKKISEIKEDDDEHSVDYEYEPSEAEILNQMLPLYLTTEIYSAILESYSGELAARMMAMDSATNNADEMIAKLTLTYNRLRQAAITKEISEIVGGVNALLD